MLSLFLFLIDTYQNYFSLNAFEFWWKKNVRNSRSDDFRHTAHDKHYTFEEKFYWF